MSKILESLQDPVVNKKEQIIGSESRTKSKERYIETQEQLADIYFGAKTPPKAIDADPLKEALKELPAPTVVRIAESKTTFIWPWIITTFALLICSVALFSTKKISIQVQVSDESVVGSANQTTEAPISIITEELRIINPLDSDLINSAIPEIEFISPLDFNFAGGAVLNSSKDREQMVLANSSLSNLAYAVVHYSPPINTIKQRLYFEVRGAIGGEQLELIFKDINGNTSLNWKTLVPLPQGLDSSWQSVSVGLESTEYFSANQITQMRFEFGTQRTNNNTSAVAMFRNFQWIPVNEAYAQMPTSIIQDDLETAIEQPLLETPFIEADKTTILSLDEGIS